MRGLQQGYGSKNVFNIYIFYIIGGRLLNMWLMIITIWRRWRYITTPLNLWDKTCCLCVPGWIEVSWRILGILTSTYQIHNLLNTQHIEANQYIIPKILASSPNKDSPIGANMYYDLHLNTDCGWDNKKQI